MHLILTNHLLENKIYKKKWYGYGNIDTDLDFTSQYYDVTLTKDGIDSRWNH